MDNTNGNNRGSVWGKVKSKYIYICFFIKKKTYYTFYTVTAFLFRLFLILFI